MSILSARKKFVFYTVLPLVAIIILSLSDTLESKKTYDNLIVLEKLVHISIDASNLAQQIQKERSLTLDYLISKNSKLSNLLLLQYQKTDEKIDLYKQHFFNEYITSKNNQIELFSTLEYSFEKLTTLRKKVKQLRVSNKLALFEYSKTINQLLDIVGLSEKPLVNNEINKYIYSYFTFLLAKEQVMLEKSLLSEILEKKQSNKITYSDVVSLRTLQKSYLHLSLENTTNALRTTFNEKIKSNNIHDIEKFEEKIFSSEKNVHLDMDSDDWFNEVGKKIDLLEELEVLYINTIKEEMKSVKKSVLTNIFIKILITLVVVWFFVFFTKSRVRKLTQYFNDIISDINTANEEKIKNYEEVVLSFVDIIDQRDSYTAGHTKRVSLYCKLIAKQMNYSNFDVEQIGKAALLHDIGKIQTPDSILLKPSKLTKLEYQLIKEHSYVGYKILNEMQMYKDLAIIIKSHHERYDGNGYPDGLKANEINDLSRILIVADAFDAMTTNRIYKPRMSKQEAIKELTSLTSIQFHPEVVDAAKVVLADITIDGDIHQKPLTNVEKERFSYFYKDQLTHCYNSEYYKIKIIENQNSYDYLAKTSIKLKNFSKYNTQHGWGAGNKILQIVSDFLNEKFINDYLFRVEGDDFEILHLAEIAEPIIDNLQNELKGIISSDIIEFEIHNEKLIDTTI